MEVPLVSQWKGMTLIVNETVPRDGYVVADAQGNVLSGGNVRTGKVWMAREGEPSRIYVRERLARELIMNADQVVEGPVN